MLINILEEPKDEKYINLMNYALSKNNILTFEIVDFDTKERVTYDKKVKNILEELKQDLIKIESNTYYYKITPKIKEFLLKESKLYNFLYPNNPENICILNNDTVWLQTVSHEKICTIYGNKKDAEYIEKLGIKCIEENVISSQAMNWTSQLTTGTWDATVLYQYYMENDIRNQCEILLRNNNSIEEIISEILKTAPTEKSFSYYKAEMCLGLIEVLWELGVLTKDVITKLLNKIQSIEKSTKQIEVIKEKFDITQENKDYKINVQEGDVFSYKLTGQSNQGSFSQGNLILVLDKIEKQEEVERIFFRVKITKDNDIYANEEYINSLEYVQTGEIEGVDIFFPIKVYLIEIKIDGEMKNLKYIGNYKNIEKPKYEFMPISKINIPYTNLKGIEKDVISAYEKNNLEKYKEYSNSWKIGDTYAYKIEQSKNSKLDDRYLIFRKIENYQNNTAHEIPIVYVQITNDTKIPTTKEEIEELEYIIIGNRGNVRHDYRIRLEVPAINEKMIYIGNFTNVISPQDEYIDIMKESIYMCSLKNVNKILYKLKEFGTSNSPIYHKIYPQNITDSYIKFLISVQYYEKALKIKTPKGANVKNNPLLYIALINSLMIKGYVNNPVGFLCDEDTKRETYIRIKELKDIINNSSSDDKEKRIQVLEKFERKVKSYNYWNEK